MAALHALPARLEGRAPAVYMIGREYLLTTRADPRDVLGLGRRVPLAQPRRVRVLARASFRGGGPARSVLVEDVETGERLVRPFRGLRRPRAS